MADANSLSSVMPGPTQGFNEDGSINPLGIAARTGSWPIGLALGLLGQVLGGGGQGQGAQQMAGPPPGMPPQGDPGIQTQVQPLPPQMGPPQMLQAGPYGMQQPVMPMPPIWYDPGRQQG